MIDDAPYDAPPTEALITGHFRSSIDAKINHAELLQLPLAEAANLITESLLHEGKLLIATDAMSSPLADLMCRGMHHGREMARPGLPSLVLPAEAWGTYSSDETAQRALQTFCRETDALLTISCGSLTTSLATTVATAQTYGIGVVTLTSGTAQPTRSPPYPPEVELHIESDDQYRVQELQLFALFCLTDLIEKTLFGGVTR